MSPLNIPFQIYAAISRYNNLHYSGILVCDLGDLPIKITALVRSGTLSVDARVQGCRILSGKGRCGNENLHARRNFPEKIGHPCSSPSIPTLANHVFSVPVNGNRNATAYEHLLDNSVWRRTTHRRDGPHMFSAFISCILRKNGVGFFS